LRQAFGYYEVLLGEGIESIEKKVMAASLYRKCGSCSNLSVGFEFLDASPTKLVGYTHRPLLHQANDDLDPA
jgi:hypothetical protein